MADWYDKYLTVYGKPFGEVPREVIDGTRERLAALQSSQPVASIVVIAYNEETHLQACLWAISEIKCKYPVEIIGVDNDSSRQAFPIILNTSTPAAMHGAAGCNTPVAGTTSTLTAIRSIRRSITN
jgi:hypothetical protein